jgi:hypothetical protein
MKFIVVPRMHTATTVNRSRLIDPESVRAVARARAPQVVMGASGYRKNSAETKR